MKLLKAIISGILATFSFNGLPDDLVKEYNYE